MLRLLEPHPNPKQNGRHELMHRELKAEAMRPPGWGLRTQQHKLNKFVNEYNKERSHGALGLETPSAVHMLSRRAYYKNVREWEYPSYCQVKRTTKNGAFRWRSTEWVMVSTSLIDKYVGLEEIAGSLRPVYFSHKL